ncbi:MAG TPA: hypothetical protein VM889_08315 [Candidatus Thermoplasmatota archaeon]|nr:hypothetical protein [Candidatus Thermoplasmatota archaeon]
MARPPLALLVVLALLAAPMALARHAEIAWEADEPSPSARQRTCVSDAVSGGGESCAVEPTGSAHPVEGVRILDAFAVSGASTSHPFTTVGNSLASPDDLRMTATSATSIHRAASPQRESGGLANVFLPGHVEFAAWFGPWHDVDADRAIDLVVTQHPQSGWTGYGPGNEFLARIPDVLVAFVEPGSHPVVGDPTRPRAHEPDFVYEQPSSAPDRLRRANGGVIFLDGNLLERYAVESVSDPVLVADATTGRPYTLRDASLVDIDVYAAVAPGPVEAVNAATLAPAVAAVNSPGIGLCPESCIFPPFAGGEAAAVASAIYGGYPLETDPGDPYAAAPGRAASFRGEYAAWADLVPGQLHHVSVGSLLLARPYPLAGKGVAGGVAVPPGAVFTVDLWTGLWMDASRDGVVGVAADPEDPYEGGNRPIPHRYLDARGEFLPENGRFPQGAAPSFTLVPERTWGEAGILVLTRGGTPLRATSEDCPAPGHPSSLCVLTGATTFALRESGTVETGRATTKHVLYFPEGTRAGGFTICAAVRELEYRHAGIDVRETVGDCDFIERLEP